MLYVLLNMHLKYEYFYNTLYIKASSEMLPLFLSSLDWLVSCITICISVNICTFAWWKPFSSALTLNKSWADWSSHMWATVL